MAKWENRFTSQENEKKIVAMNNSLSGQRGINGRQIFCTMCARNVRGSYPAVVI